MKWSLVIEWISVIKWSSFKDCTLMKSFFARWNETGILWNNAIVLLVLLDSSFQIRPLDFPDSYSVNLFTSPFEVQKPWRWQLHSFVSALQVLLSPMQMYLLKGVGALNKAFAKTFTSRWKTLNLLLGEKLSIYSSEKTLNLLLRKNSQSI